MEVSAKELSIANMVDANEYKYSRVIDNGVVKNWVGIGWIEEGKATEDDRTKYPTVSRSE